jgi:hypothetical protein
LEIKIKKSYKLNLIDVFIILKYELKRVKYHIPVLYFKAHLQLVADRGGAPLGLGRATARPNIFDFNRYIRINIIATRYVIYINMFTIDINDLGSLVV